MTTASTALSEVLGREIETLARRTADGEGEAVLAPIRYSIERMRRQLAAATAATTTAATTTAASATARTVVPARLRDGSWGALVSGPHAAQRQGETVTITARDGRTWEVLLDRLVETTVRGSTYRTRPVAAHRPGATRVTGVCRSCGGRVQSYSQGRSSDLCHDCC